MNNPNKPILHCIFFPDLLAWERECFEPILQALSANYDLRRWEASTLRRGSLKEIRATGHVWVISHRWQHALRFFSSVTRTRLFVSVLGPVSSHDSIAMLFVRRFRSFVPRGVTLLAHSPLSYRFLREIQHVSESQIAFLPLGIPTTRVESEKTPVQGRPFVVGTLARFTSESNLHYFLTVAHYVTRQRPDIRFKLMGAGLLTTHLKEMISSLELREQVSVHETRESAEVRSLDLFLFTPLQNEHFIPLLHAGAAGLPVISLDLPGIDSLIVDGRDGFLVSVNETRPMGELILRLASDDYLRESIASRMAQRLRAELSPERCLPAYEQAFFNVSPPRETSSPRQTAA